MSGRKLVKHTLVYTLGSLLINGGSFLLIPVYARNLTPEEYGIWGTITIFNTLLIAVLGLGINGIITRYYYEYQDQKEWRRFFSTITKFVLALGLVVATLLTIYGQPLLDGLFKAVRFDPYLKIAIWGSYLGLFPLIALSLFQAKQQALTYRSYTTAAFVILTISTFTLVVYQNMGVMGVLYGTVISGAIMAPIYAVSIYKEGTTETSIENLKSALIFGVPVMTYNITGSITEIASRYFVGQLSTLDNLGVFNLAQQYASGLIIVATAISMAWTPIFYANATKPNSKQHYGQIGLAVLALLTTIALFLSLNAHVFLKLLPEKYIESEQIIPILLLSYIVGNGLWILTITPIIYAKKTYVLPWLTCASGAICIALSIALIPKLGLKGAAIAQLTGYIALIAATYPIAQKAYKIEYPKAKIALLITAAAFIFATSKAIPSDSTMTELINNAALLAIYLLALWGTKIVTPKTIAKILKSQ